MTFPVPNKDLLNVTNGVSGTGSLGLQADECGAQWGKSPSFMLVDVRLILFYFLSIFLLRGFPSIPRPFITPSLVWCLSRLIAMAMLLCFMLRRLGFLTQRYFQILQFYDYGGGSVFQVAASLNGVSYSPTMPIAPPISATATTTNGGASSPTTSYQKDAAASRFAPGMIGLSTLLGTSAMIGSEVVGATMLTAAMLLLSWSSAFGTVL